MAYGSTEIPAVPVKPRLSATLIVINAQNEILFVQRNTTNHNFGGATVFPGGNFDSRQDDSPEDTAIRETFEETGLLLAYADAKASTCKLPSKAECEAGREAVHANKVTFKQFLSHHGLVPATRYLLSFSSWVTPPNYPRRFRAQFFVAFLCDVFPVTSPGDSDETRRQAASRSYEVTPDKNEITSVFFMHPTDALRAFKNHQLTIPTPQAYNIATLGEILGSRLCTTEEQTRIRELSGSMYGRMTLHPLILSGDGYKGRVIFTYEGDETRGGPKGQLHRSIDYMDGGAYVSSDTLYRSFDPFAFKKEWFDKYHPKL